MDLRVLQDLSHGMYVIAARNADRFNGQIVHRVMQISTDPPTVAVSINQQNLTHEYIIASGRYTISVLEQKASLRLVRRFGFQSGRDQDKFRNLDHGLSAEGLPYLVNNCLAYLSVRVVEAVTVHGFTLFIGEVVEAERLQEGKPMAYSFTYQLRREAALAAAAVPVNEENRLLEPDDLSLNRYQCQVCGYIYDPAQGDPEFGVMPGTPFSRLPADWTCPLCDEGPQVFRRYEGRQQGFTHKQYSSDQLTVHWYPELCSHSAKCLRLLPQVFDQDRRPWIDISAASAEEIIRTIDRCPSGALKYSLPPDSALDPALAQGVGWIDYALLHPPTVRLRLVPEGPFLVEGTVEITELDGTPVRIGSRFALCHCGLTTNPPFCNNNHNRRGKL